MKATELKLGDYFYIENSLVKIKAIHGELSVTIAKYGDIALAGFEDLLPIPLTSEILEKNGFNHHKDKEDDFWMEKEHYFCLDVRSDGSFHYCQKKVEYVHELQHLLWALGMNDDLKI